MNYRVRHRIHIDHFKLIYNSKYYICIDANCTQKRVSTRFPRLEKQTRKYDISSSQICHVHSCLDLSFSMQGRGFISGNFPFGALHLIFWDAVITLFNQIADVFITYAGRAATTTLWVTKRNVITCRTWNVWRNTVLLDNSYKKLGLGTNSPINWFLVNYLYFQNFFWDQIITMYHLWLMPPLSTAAVGFWTGARNVMRKLSCSQ